MNKVARPLKYTAKPIHNFSSASKLMSHMAGSLTQTLQSHCVRPCTSLSSCGRKVSSRVVDVGLPTCTSPALDMPALCLSSWPAAIFTQTLTSDTPASHCCQLTADSLLQNDSPLARRLPLHHCLRDLGNNHFTDTYLLPWFQTSNQLG